MSMSDMIILKGTIEDSTILESQHQSLYIAKKDVGCYAIEIKKDQDNKRVFNIPYKGLMDRNGLKVHEIFEEFIISMFGNYVLRGEYNNPGTIFDIEEKTITILSDSNNNAALRITYTSLEIKIEIIKLQENNLNSAVYLYNDCNLRGGYINMLRELFEKLNNLALEPNIPQERIRRNN